MTLIEVGLVRFAVGAAVVLVMGEPRLNTRGFDITTEGYARPPGGTPVLVRRVGRNLWRQA